MITRNYHVLLEHVSDGIIGVSGDGLVTFCNPVAQRRIGGDVSLVGQPFPSLFAPGDPNHGVSWRYSFFPGLILSQEKMFVDHGKFFDSKGAFFDACYAFVPLLPGNQNESSLLIFNEARWRRRDNGYSSKLGRHDCLTGLPNELVLGENLEKVLTEETQSKKLLDALLGRLVRNSDPKL